MLSFSSFHSTFPSAYVTLGLFEAFSCVFLFLLPLSIHFIHPSPFLLCFSLPPNTQARLLSQAAVHLQHLKDACRALTPTGHVPTAVPSPSPTGSGAAALAEEGAWAVVGVSFCGRVEEAKLLALEGRQDMAVRLLQHLLRPDLPLHASQGSPSPAATSAAAAASAASAASTAAAAACVPVPDRVYTLGLAAKWLGETRSIRFGS
ncbi:unnamed protein product [Closterium sp. NIES-54]